MTTETPAAYAAALARLAEVGVGKATFERLLVGIDGTTAVLGMKTVDATGKVAMTVLTDDLTLRILRDTLREVVFEYVKRNYGYAEWVPVGINMEVDAGGPMKHYPTLLQAAHAVANHEQSRKEPNDDR